MLIAGVHGQFSTGAGSTDLLLDLLYQKSHNTRELDWGPKGPIGSALVCKHVAKRLRDLYPQVVIAHSYGCRIVTKAMELGAHFRLVFLFNPPLTSDYAFPETRYGRIHIIVNEEDTLLKLAARFLGYGDLGIIGYHGRSPNITQHFGPGPTPASFGDHHRAFETRHIAQWARFIDEQIRSLENA